MEDEVVLLELCQVDWESGQDFIAVVTDADAANQSVATYAGVAEERRILARGTGTGAS